MNQEAADMLPAEIRDRGYISIGSPFDYPPFAHLNEAGERVGADYELGNEIAARLGLEARWDQVGTFSALIPGLESGRYDLAMDGVAAKEERLPIVSFVEYFEAVYVLQVHIGNPLNIDPDNMCGVTIGVTTGTNESQIVEAMSNQCVADGKPALDIKWFGDSATALNAFANNQVPSHLGDAVYLQSLADANPGTRELLYPENADWPTQISGLAVRKDMPDLGRAIETVLNDMQADGTYQRILESHGIPEQVFLMPARFVEEGMQ